MQKIELPEIKNLVEYEKVREAERARIIAHKRNRRLSVGDSLSFLFENRDTVLFQIHEMLRSERIVDEAKIQEEVDSYNALIPAPGELSATLFIEILDLHLMTQEQVRVAVNRFQGLDRDGVWLTLGERFRIPARFEGGHSKEEKMAAVHYLRFPIAPEAHPALASPSHRVRLVVDHPNYKAEREIPAEVRAEMLRDLA